MNEERVERGYGLRETCEEIKAILARLEQVMPST